MNKLTADHPPPLTLLRRILRLIAMPVVVTLAILYFVIDGLFLSMIKPIARRVARLPVFGGLARWAGGLGPYATLALFLLPLIVLEPLKPFGFYLIGTRRVLAGALIIALGEVIKIYMLERLFHMSRDKLMSIPLFAWGYRFATGWLAYLQALPPWQAVLRAVHRIRHLARRLRDYLSP
jgi:hypothetical protein